MFKAELVLHSVCQKLSTLCLRLLRTQKLNSLLKIFHSAVKAPWVSKPRSGLRPLFTQVTSLPTVMPAKAGDCIPYLPTGFITESVALCRNTLIGKQPAKAGISHTRTRMAAFVKSLKVCHSTVKAPWVRNPPRGFSLAEVLVVGVVGSVILAGSLQSLSVTVQSSQVIRSSLVEKDFVKSVGKIVSAPALCKANFTPATGKLEGTNSQSKGIGTITTLTDKVCKYEVSGCTDTSENGEYPYSPLTTCKVASDCPEPSHTCTGGGSPTETKKCVGAISITSEDDTSTPNVKEYEFKNALEIISLKLTADEDPAEPPKGADKIRTFSVFYKKLGMGQLTELIPGQCKRKTGTVSAKTDGCYSHQCKIRYKLNDAGTAVLNCEALDCIEEGMYECSGGMVRNADDTACICPAHTPNWDGSKCIDCEAIDAREPWWNGAECDPCPPNLIFNRNNRKCEACSAPTPKPNRATNRCEACPTTTPPTPWWHNGTCKTCPSNEPKYKTSDNICVTCHSLDSTKPKWDSGTCKSCQAFNNSKPKWHNGTCKSCQAFNPSKPKWHNGTCKSCQAFNNSKPKWHNGTCKSCHAFNNSKPKWHNGTCKSCHAFNNSKPKWHNGTCKSCQAFNPSKPKWDGNRCVVNCPSHQNFIEGQCINICGNGQKRTGGTCAPCPPQSPKSTSSNTCVACHSSTPKYNIQTNQCETCPSGTTWNGSICASRCPNYWEYWHQSSSSCKRYCSETDSQGKQSEYPRWFGGRCTRCGTEPKYISSNNTCIKCYSFDTTKPYWSTYSRECKACPGNKILTWWRTKGHFGSCLSCSLSNQFGTDSNGAYYGIDPGRGYIDERKYFDRTTKRCKTCPDATPRWNGSQCVSCYTYNSSKPKWVTPTQQQPFVDSYGNSFTTGFRCVACPNATPRYYSSNNTCRASGCPSNRPHWNHRTNRCVACSSYGYYIWSTEYNTCITSGPIRRCLLKGGIWTSGIGCSTR